MSHATSIGLDVHARSITAVALSRDTGEVVSRKFGYDPAELASWILGFEDPKCVYESGVTGFHLVRELRSMGIDCVVGAVSKMVKPPADKRRKNDRADAEFLARQLLAHSIKEVFVPDEETEGARCLSRALEDARDDLVRAKHRLTHLLIRWGHVWNERTPDGRRRAAWSRAHWKWIRGIDLPDQAAQESLDFHVAQVRHLEAQKKALEKRIFQHAKKERWNGRVEALRCMKGIEAVTAFALVVEVGAFSRFGSARDFAAWLGLVPSQHSSADRIVLGGITKTGNSHLRRLLVESAWHYASAAKERKRGLYDDAVPASIANHAAKGVERLVDRRKRLMQANKRPAVANVAIARELSGWAWALGRMCEGTLPCAQAGGPPSGRRCGRSLRGQFFHVPHSTGRWTRPKSVFWRRGEAFPQARLFVVKGERVQP